MMLQDVRVFPLLLLGASAALSAPVMANDCEKIDAQTFNTDPFYGGINTRCGLSTHRDLMFAPITWAENYVGKESEVIFRISAKVRFKDWPLYFAYNQTSFWQAYSKADSAPFRESNYNPELFLRFEPGNWLSSKWGFDAGIDHESNGKELPDSRSWNRVYATAWLPLENDVWQIKIWSRMKEDAKKSPTDARGDDNPDITDYYGYASLHWRHRFPIDGNEDDSWLHVMLRGNTGTGKGAVHIDYTWPLDDGDIYWHAFVWHGYGESLIDYKQETTRVGLGITLRR